MTSKVKHLKSYLIGTSHITVSELISVVVVRSVGVATTNEVDNTTLTTISWVSQGFIIYNCNGSMELDR